MVSSEWFEDESCLLEICFCVFRVYLSSVWLGVD